MANFAAISRARGASKAGLVAKVSCHPSRSACSRSSSVWCRVLPTLMACTFRQMPKGAQIFAMFCRTTNNCRRRLESSCGVGLVALLC